jgi:hypothetical protein
MKYFDKFANRVSANQLPKHTENLRSTMECAKPKVKKFDLKVFFLMHPYNVPETMINIDIRSILDSSIAKSAAWHLECQNSFY